MHSDLRVVFVVSLSLLGLAACGGGGGGGGSAAPPPASASVVFTRAVSAGNNDLYLVKEDGTGTLVLANTTDSESFRGITPSGRVVYDRSIGGQSDVYSVNADGTGTVALANSADYESFGGFTSSGRVVYQRTIISTGQSNLYSVNADGTGTVVTLTNTTDGASFRSITPSGRVVYERVIPIQIGCCIFTFQSDLYSVNDDGTGTVVLANTTNSESFGGITPSGRVVYGSTYYVQTGPGSYTSQSDVYSVNADGTGRVALANSADYELFRGITPSGRVVYQRSIGTGQSDLYSVNADGTGTVVTLANSADYELFRGITPSGRVVYERRIGGGQSDLYSVNADGTGTVVLANTTNSESFSGSF